MSMYNSYCLEIIRKKFSIIKLMEINVGQRIRQLRIKNGLTQEELASRCELTKGFLSQLENDIAVPSLATLMDIVEVLGTNMSDFFKESQNDKVVFDEEDFFTDDKDDYVINWIVPTAQKNHMEPIIIEIQPGHRSQTVEPHEGEEFGYVLSGTVYLISGKERYKVRNGSTFYINGDKEHYLENESKKPAKVLWICNPPVF